MNDVFLEYLVAKKKTSKDKIIIALIIFGAVLLSLGLFSLMFGLAISMTDSSMAQMRSMLFSIGLLVIGFEWYLVIILLNSKNIEFEYILTNNELDIDKVMSKKGRKHLISIDIKNASLMAKINDKDNNHCFLNPPEGVKILNYSAMNDLGDTYFIDCNVEDERKIVLFQPTQKMVEALWRYNPKAVIKTI